MTDPSADSSLSTFLGYVLPDIPPEGWIEAITLFLWCLIVILGLRALLQTRHFSSQALGTISALRAISNPLSERATTEGQLLAREAAKDCADTIAKDMWREFDETLVPDDDGTLHNTVPAAEAFAEHRIAPKLIGNRLLGAMPAILTSIGLLGTFFGMAVGLDGLDIQADPDTLIGQMGELVRGAQTGFTASMWGVLLGIITNWSTKSRERKVVHALHEFQNSVDRKFEFRPPEQFLADIAKNSRESALALQEFHEKVGAQLQNSISEINSATVNSFIEAMHDQLNPLITHLASVAQNQSAEVVSALTEQITETFRGVTGGVAQELAESAQHMTTSVTYMTDSLAAHADDHVERMDALARAAATQLEALQQSITRERELFEESGARQRDQAEESAGLLRDAGEAAGSALTTAASQASDVLATTSSVIAQAGQGLSDVSGSLETVSSALEQAADTVRNTLTETLTATHALVEATTGAAQAVTGERQAAESLLTQVTTSASHLQQVSGVLAGSFAGLREAQGAFFDDLERHVTDASERLAAWLAAYGNAVENQTERRMNEWNNQTQEFTSGMVTALESLNEVVDSLHSHATAASRRAAPPAPGQQQTPSSPVSRDAR